MTALVLVAVVFNIFVALAVAILWVRMLRPPKEDPRLSRGLQLLQSKISVMEDLSDRTDNQVQQLMRILDERTKGLQTKMLQAEELTNKIEQSMHKSIEVAEIFQDKIPHQEIIERNQQSKYVLAAKLAHDGLSVDEILKQVELPRSEVEFIAKVNCDELTFDPAQLPEWAKPKGEHRQELEAKMVERVFHSSKPDLSSLHRADKNFKQSVREVQEHEQRELARVQKFDESIQKVEDRASTILQTAKTMGQELVSSARPIVRKVEFPRVFVGKSR